MTSIFDDLEICETDLRGYRDSVMGRCILDVLELRNVTELHGHDHKEERFVIEIRRGVSEEELDAIVCHELEHYNVFRTLLRLRLLKESDLVCRERMRELHSSALLWEHLHSNPSRGGHATLV